MGATTTFLGIMPMAFAQNAIFRVFFKMFLVIITFGVSAACSFIFFPLCAVLLSFLLLLVV